MKSFLKAILIALSTVSFSLSSYAYAPLSFKPVPNTQGLTNDNVVTILQDSHGYMWFGTDHGLNRYDGYQMKAYLTDGIENKHIFSVLEDGDSVVWVTKGYGNDVNAYDRESDKFVSVEEFFAERGLDVREVVRAFVDTEGMLWLSTQKDGLLCYDSKNNTFTDYQHPGSTDVYCVLRNGKDIYATTHGAILKMTEGSSRVDSVKVSDPDLISMINRRPHISLLKDDDSNIWLYSPEFPWLWVKKPGKNFEKFPLPGDGYVVNSVVDDHQGSVWVATNQMGAFRVNKATGEVQNVKTSSGDADGFYNINMLYVDRLNNVWGGGFNTGVRMLSDRDRAVQAYNIPGENVIMLFLDSKKRLWVGAEGKGITIRNPYKAEKVEIPDCNVTAVAEDHQGRIWIGTFLTGLFCYDNGKITHYNTQNSKLPEDNIYAISVDANDYLWLGTLNHGLVRFTGEYFTREFENLNSVSSIAYDIDGNKLYVGSDMGLGVLDLPTGKSEVLISNRNGDVTFPSRSIQKVVYSTKGLLWIGMAGGVVIWNPATDEAEVVTTAEGLPGNLIFSMLEDNNGNMWVTTDKGAAEIRHDAHGTRVRSYTKADGLLSLRSSFNALSPGSNGDMIIGTDGGFTFIDISEADKEYTKLPFAITEIQVNGEPLPMKYVKAANDIDIANTYKARGENISEVIEIYIPRAYTKKGSSLLLHLSDFNYALVGRQRLMGNLDNQKEWLNIENNEVMIRQLASGMHELRIRRMNTLGDGEDDITLIRIEVQPQWWASAWAYLLYFLLGAGLISLMLMLNLRYKRAKAREIAMTKQVEAWLNHNAKIDVKPTPISVNRVDEEFVKKAIAAVEENLANSDFSVEELASMMSMSRTGFYRKINALTGKSPLEFIQFLRLSHAKTMLEAGMNVAEVAYAVGYNQPKYFSKQFAETFGVTPSDYRRKYYEV